MKTTTFVLFAGLLFCSFYLQAQKKTYNFITDFGAKADNKTDCYPALVKAAAALTKAGGGTLNIPKGKYYVAAVKIHGGNKKNTVEDVLFKNCNGLTIKGNNSVFRMNGKFSRKPDYDIANIKFKYAYENTVCPFMFSNCKNTILKDVELYGEVDKMKNDGVVEGMSYGVCIYDNDGDTCSNVQLLHITAHHFAADGFLIRSNGKKITVKNCKSYCNARQGLSITKGKDILVYNSSFDSTGITGAYGFHWPAAGIDVENEFKPGDIDNVLIRKCNLRNNNGFQIVTTLPSYNVTVDSCFIKDSEQGYGRGLNGVGMYGLSGVITNSIIFGSIQVDIADQGYRGEKIQQIKNNIIYSGNRAIICSDFNRPVNIDGNIIIVLPKPVVTYYPYIQSTNCTFNNNIFLMHPDRIKDETTQVTSLVQKVKECTDNFWLLNKNTFTKEWIKGYHYYSVAFTDIGKFGKQFFPVNTYTEAMGYKEKRFITDVQQEKFISASFCNTFKQTVFSNLYIQQAATMRKYAAAIAAGAKN